jgi:hypothetical protein
MDTRTRVFLALTLSVCVNSFACALATLPIPGTRNARAALGSLTFRAALVSALLGFLYRIAYSLKRPPSFTLAGVKAVMDPIVDSNGFQYSAYALIFLPGRPIPTVLFPLATCAAYQAGTILNKHFGHTGFWVKSGGAALFQHAQENMHRAMMTCATTEISTLPIAVAELFTPRRSFARTAALIILLHRRRSCPDNTVFRIKYTYYDAGYYHRQFWSMLDEKTAPVIAKVPPLAALVRAAKTFFFAAPEARARKPKAT